MGHDATRLCTAALRRNKTIIIYDSRNKEKSWTRHNEFGFTTTAKFIQNIG